MKNISVHVGFIALSEQKDGHLSPATQMGISWHHLDPLQLTLLEEVLLEFKSDFDALEAKIAARTTELGYGMALASGETDEAAVDQARAAAKGNSGQGNNR